MADPLWINASAGSPAYSAGELRQAMALALTYGGRAMGARGGVRPGGTQLQVTLAGSVITVRAGVACVDPGLTTPQGPYWVAVPADETPGPLAGADATNPRKDIVILRVYDHDEDSSGLRTARSEYIPGIAGASPTEPAVPAGAIRLATIDVPASPGAAAVTDRRPFTVAPGGILPVRDQAERDALPAYSGLHVWRLDLRREEHHDGTSWVDRAATQQVITASGTWNRPAGAKSVRVQVQAGGGAGGGAPVTAASQVSGGTGAQGGAYAEQLFDAGALSSSVTVTVGAGGTAASGAAGGDGGASSFGASVTAAGGAGGTINGSGGTPFTAMGPTDAQATVGAIQIPGTPGGFCARLGSVTGQLIPGQGGGSHLGSGGAGGALVGAAGNPGRGYGGGGGGAANPPSSTAKAGGAGAAGVVIVTTYF